MATSKKVQLALIAVGAALLTGAVVVFGLPSRDGVVTSAPPADRPAAGGPTARPPAAVEAAAPPAASGAGAVPGRASAPASATSAAAADGGATPPAFDIVRVGPAGDSVIAGRAAPGKTLELLVNGQVHDRADVRESGAFALTPPALPPGDHELTLREVARDGSGTVSQQSVTVVLSPDRTSPPVVALTEPDKPTALLSSGGVVARELNGTKEADIIADVTPQDETAVAQAETPAPATATAAAPPDSVVIATVEAEAGRLYVSGRAPPASSVRLYLNDTFLAQGRTSDGAAVSFRIDSGVPPGDYRVRLDQVSPGDGKVLSRAEVAFSMPETQPEEPQAATEPEQAASAEREAADGSHVVVPEVRAVRVERGDSLWRISRRVYGHGVRYTVIYDANQGQIRNPDRIYPGQLFVLPATPPGAGG